VLSLDELSTADLVSNGTTVIPRTLMITDLSSQNQKPPRIQFKRALLNNPGDFYSDASGLPRRHRLQAELPFLEWERVRAI
jgi:hypothetical protein